MSDHFLEEQLRRIRLMTEQVAQSHSRAAELAAMIERERGIPRNGQAQTARDVRSYSGDRQPVARVNEHGRRPSPPASRRRRK